METSVKNFTYAIMIGPLALSLYLLFPSYYYFMGLNLAFLYPVILLLVTIFIQGKIHIYNFTTLGTVIFCLYLFYLFTLSTFQGGVLYGFATFCSTIGLIYLTLSLVNNTVKFKKFLDYILIIVFICCVLGIFEAVFGVNLFQLMSLRDIEFYKEIRMGHLRIAVQFVQPIVYGLFLILASPIVINRLFYSEKLRIKYFTAIIYVLMWINILLTASRAPIFGFIILQLIYFYIIMRNKFFLVSITAIILGAVVIQISSLLDLQVFKIFNGFIKMFTAIFGGDSGDVYSGVADRYRIIDWVIEKVDKNVLFGNGITAVFEYDVHAWQVKKSIENEYLNTFFHLGVIGMIFQIGAFVSNLYYCFRYDKKYQGLLLTYRRRNNLGFLESIGIALLVYYLVIITSGESSAITMHIMLISIAITYTRLARKHISNLGDKQNE